MENKYGVDTDRGFCPRCSHHDCVCDNEEYWEAEMRMREKDEVKRKEEEYAEYLRLKEKYE